MTVIGDHLFYRRDQVDLDAVLRHKTDQLSQYVDQMPEARFAAMADHEVAIEIAKAATIQPLEVDFGSATANVEEVQVEVHDKFGFERGPVRVAGLRATKTFSFKGDAELWRLRTNPFNMNPPRGTVRGRTLIIGIEVAAHQADDAKRYIDEAIASLPEYLERQRAQIQTYNDALPSRAMPHIQQRRARLGHASELLKKLQG